MTAETIRKTRREVAIVMGREREVKEENASRLLGNGRM